MQTLNAISVYVLAFSREIPKHSRKRLPELANYSAFSFIRGDVLSFEFPQGSYTHLVHAATDARADLNEHNPLLMFDTVLTGTRRVLDFAVEQNIARMLNLSSGAVYGPFPPNIKHVKEDWLGGPDCQRAVNAYAEGKRAAEMLCAIYEKQFGLEITTARIFALLGPYLPLDAHFAAGNFIQDAIQGKRIIVNSSGASVRSYLYPSDLIIMLLSLLLRSVSQKAYNIGSPDGISIKELALKIAGLLGKAGCDILGKEDAGWNPGRYTPDVELLAADFGLRPTVSLDEAILRTALWNGWQP